MAAMTIKQCMDAAFQHLNQYSIAGALVPLSYNDQADAQNRMLNLINDAQMQIATTSRPIEEFFEVDVPKIPHTTPTQEITVTLPDDCIHPIAAYFTPSDGGPMLTQDARQFKWIDENIMLLPNRPAGHYKIKYARYPVRYDASTNVNTTTLDNRPETHEIIPYFVAAMIVADENPKVHFILYNVWETRMARLGYRPAHAVSTQVEDVYGFDMFGGIW